MKELSDIVQALAGVSPATLGPFIILGAFGLAAFAIFAVLSVTKGRK